MLVDVSSTLEPFALPLPPSSAIRFLKVLWHVSEAAATSDFLAYNYGMQMRALPGPGETGDPDQWMRVQVVFDNNLSIVNSDMAVFTFDILNYTNGAIDNSWTQADFDNVHTEIVTFLNAITARIHSRYTLTTIRFYRMIFTAPPVYPLPPNYVDKPFEDSGAPVATYQHTTAMTGTGNTIDQFACSVTEEVPLRHHWGRFYLPSMGSNSVGNNGRLTITAVDEVATQYNNLLGRWANAGFYTVVAHTQNQNRYIRALSNVTGIHVDDVPDVIRRRRPKYVGYKKSFNAAQPAGVSSGLRAELADLELPPPQS